jgi:Ca-activated chloride channel family protein
MRWEYAVRWQFGAVLLGLLLAPLYIVLDGWLSSRAPAVRYATLALLPASGHRALWLRRVLRAAAIGAIVLAMAHPEAPLPAAGELVEGIDICIALDISRSMRAEDLPPSRLEAAKEALRDFVHTRRNDRIGLVVFAGEAFLQSPLTLDHDALAELIREADFDLTDVEGTAIGDALAQAASRLQRSSARSRAIVLTTDGEHNRGDIDPHTAARAAATVGIRVYTVGIGGPMGAPIPIDDPIYGKTYARNTDGSLLLTKLDEPLLRDIADATGGQYFNAADKNSLERIYREIDRLERSVLEHRPPAAFQSVAHWFYLAAFVLVLTDAVLGRTWLRTLP